MIRQCYILLFKERLYLNPFIDLENFSYKCVTDLKSSIDFILAIVKSVELEAPAARFIFSGDRLTIVDCLTINSMLSPKRDFLISQLIFLKK